ncbi:MAG: hypothetical protein HOY79_40305 [Streptomyces sp.]|nr:hypothetical protein [Streptomyces sp.]
MSSTPDQAYDPSASAANTLRDLGHVPGSQPIRQLRQVAEDELSDATAESDTDVKDEGTSLLEAAVAALGVLTEDDLDELEQQHLADVFGLDQPGGASS